MRFVYRYPISKEVAAKLDDGTLTKMERLLNAALAERMEQVAKRWREEVDRALIGEHVL